MGFKLAELYVPIRVDGTRANRSIDGMHGRLGRLQAKMAGMATFALGWGAAFGAAIGAGLIYSMKAASDKEKSLAKLQSVLRSTGEAAGYSAKELARYSNELQNLTGTANDVIMDAEAVMATFTQVKGQVFKDAIVASLDMAAVLDTGLKENVIQLGKALNDPIKGISALSRVGVSFTAKQKAMIKALVESNDVMGAQRIILNELKVEFGGAAEAAGNTFAGQIKKAKSALDDAAATIGQALLPTVGKLAGAFTSWLQGPGGQTALENVKYIIEDIAFALSQLPALTEIASLNLEKFTALQPGDEQFRLNLEKLAALQPGDKQFPLSLWPGGPGFDLTASRTIASVEADIAKAQQRLANARFDFDEMIKGNEKRIERGTGRMAELLQPKARPSPAAPPAPDEWGPDLGPFQPYPKTQKAAEAADPTKALIDRVNAARDIFSGLAASARGQKVDLLAVMGMDLEAAKARIDNWLTDYLASLEDARNRLADLGVRLTAEQEEAFAGMEDMARRQADIEKGALGKQAKPEMTIRLGSMEDWLKRVQESAMPGGEDTAKRQLAETEKHSAKFDKMIAALETLQVGLY